MIIYAEMFGSEVFWADTSRLKERQAISRLAILRVSKEIYDEARVAMFRHGQFLFASSAEVAAFTNKNGQHIFSKIRHIKLVRGYGTLGSFCEHCGPFLRNLAIRAPRLHSIRRDGFYLCNCEEYPAEQFGVLCRDVSVLSKMRTLRLFHYEGNTGNIKAAQLAKVLGPNIRVSVDRVWVGWVRRASIKIRTYPIEEHNGFNEEV